MSSKKILGFVSVLLVATAVAVSAAKLPRPLADVKIEMPMGGKTVRLIDSRGSLRVVLLMSMHCKECTTALKTFSKVERTYRAKGVQFYGAVVDAKVPTEVTTFVIQNQPSFPVGRMSEFHTRQAGDFGENERPFVPIVLFVDKTNHVKFQFTGDTDFFRDAETRTQNVLETMLKQQ